MRNTNQLVFSVNFGTGVNIAKMVQHKRGFTLIELIITMGIIGMIMTISLPNFSAYNKKNNQKNAVELTKALIEQVGTKARNPDKGIVSYKLTFINDNVTTTGKLKFYSNNGTTDKLISESMLSSNITFNDDSELKCDVPGAVCSFGLSGALVTLDSTAKSLKISDTNTDPATVTTLNLYGSPLRVVPSP